MNIHMIGIGGAGMSGIAEVLARRGHSVTGSDLRSLLILAGCVRQASQSTSDTPRTR
jgi:UDP-N-acetylmuramate-alanine ligase